MGISISLLRAVPMLAAGCAALGSVFYVASSNLSPNAHITASPSARFAVSPKRPEPPAAKDVKFALSVVSLSPKWLTAAGVQAEQVGSIADLARSFLTEHGEAFRTAIADVRSTKREVERLERVVQGGRGTENDRTAVQSARAAYAAAVSAQEAVTDELFSASVAGLSPEVVGILRTLRANRRVELPAEYLTVARNEVDTVALRDALASTRIAARLNEPVDESRTQVIAAADSNSTVASAKSGLQANLAAVTAAWNAAVAK